MLCSRPRDAAFVPRIARNVPPECCPPECWPRSRSNGELKIMGTMSPLHWLVVLVVLLVFGPKRLGDVGKGLGQGLRGLREGLAGRDPEAPPPPPAGSEANKADS